MKMIETASRFLCGFVVIWLFGMAAVQATEAVTYYHLDATGSPVAATNSSGTLLWRERYYPYGERLKTDTAAAASTNRVWYTQHVEDNDAGLIYFGARWYNPQIGRFMSMDPVGVDLNNVHSFNRYAYANNNPYKYTDPDGRLPFLIPLIWGANAAWTAYNTYSTYQSEGAGAAAQSFVVDVGIGVATGGAATIFRGAAQVANSERGLSKYGGSFSSTTNSAGGEVVTATGKISQNDFATYVNSGVYKGDVNIISGVHGYPSGVTKADRSLFEADVARFGNIPGVTVSDFTKLTPTELNGMLNGAGTTIGGFCDSGACLAPFK